MSNDVGSRTTAKPLTERERIALSDAANRPDGWGLFNPKTTEKLAERGFFVKEHHRVYGMQWRITATGRAAYQEQPL